MSDFNAYLNDGLNIQGQSFSDYGAHTGPIQSAFLSISTVPVDSLLSRESWTAIHPSFQLVRLL